MEFPSRLEGVNLESKIGLSHDNRDPTIIHPPWMGIYRLKWLATMAPSQPRLTSNHGMELVWIPSPTHQIKVIAPGGYGEMEIAAWIIEPKWNYKGWYKEIEPIQTYWKYPHRVHPSFANLPSSPNPFSHFGRRGAGFRLRTAKVKCTHPCWGNMWKAEAMRY